MKEILYRNDKKRMILYELLQKKRKLKFSERLKYIYIRKKRMCADAERTVLLHELLNGGYIRMVGDFHLYDNVYSSEIRLRKKEITPNGEELLKKELPMDFSDSIIVRIFKVLFRFAGLG